MRISAIKGRRLTLVLLIVALLAFSFLPSAYCGYGRFVHDVLSGLLMPLSHPLSRLTSSIRMQVTPVSDGVEALLDRWEKKQEEVNLSLRLKKEIDDLRQEVGMLSNMRQQLPGQLFTLPKAQVTGRSTRSNVYSLTINRGATDGLRVGQPVVSGANLVGRLTQVGRFSSTVQLLTTKGTRIDAIITSSLSSVFELIGEKGDLCQLDVAGPDYFVSIVRKDVHIEEGYYVRLSDDEWPHSVQYFIIGQVQSVEPDYDRPLEWKRVMIKPRRSLRYLDSVTIIVPVDDEAAVPAVPFQSGDEGGGQ